MNATLMNEISKARENDNNLKEAIAAAKAGVLPEGIALAVTGTADGAEQALYREGNDIVCYKTAGGERTVTRRTPITEAVAEKLRSAFLARNNA